MNQKQQAVGIVQSIATMEARLEFLRKKLEDVLGRAQNSPPDGMSDGSLTPDDFTSMRQLERQMTYFMGSLAGAKRV